MTTDQKNGAGAYKADRQGDDRRDFSAPFHLRLAKDRELQVDYRQIAVAAGALGLGYAAFKGVQAMIGKAAKANAVAAGHTGRLEPVPLSGSVRSDVKDNAAPRFVGGQASETSSTPFVAASGQDDTGDLLVDADLSARSPEHVPTDLMSDRPPSADDRAIDAFRPDPTAPVPPEMRESLRPATGPAPSLAADRGTFAQGLSQTDGSK